ncbi:MAG: hypothetical protein JO102_07835 [Elusimicrobia bacterium]|nr:hypothetical protein [Elusimicrobiota bacterium]
MKRALVSALLIAVGAASWSLLARTARFSIKKWDAKFESVLRHSLDQAGASNGDVLSSVHEVRRDGGGEWIVHRMRIRLADPKKRHDVEESLRAAGADVSMRNDPEPTLFVRRGGRIYQEIGFAPR